MTRYDHMKLIDACGGPSQLWRGLLSMGYRMTRQSVQMWKRRGLIPGMYVLPALQVARTKRGSSFDLVIAQIEDQL